jgi:hypothetical protein
MVILLTPANLSDVDSGLKVSSSAWFAIIYCHVLKSTINVAYHSSQFFFGLLNFPHILAQLFSDTWCRTKIWIIWIAALNWSTKLDRWLEHNSVQKLVNQPNTAFPPYTHIRRQLQWRHPRPRRRRVRFPRFRHMRIKGRNRETVSAI